MSSDQWTAESNSPSVPLCSGNLLPSFHPGRQFFVRSAYEPLPVKMRASSSIHLAVDKVARKISTPTSTVVERNKRRKNFLAKNEDRRGRRQKTKTEPLSRRMPTHSHTNSLPSLLPSNSPLFYSFRRRNSEHFGPAEMRQAKVFDSHLHWRLGEYTEEQRRQETRRHPAGHRRSLRRTSTAADIPSHPSHPIQEPRDCARSGSRNPSRLGSISGNRCFPPLAAQTLRRLTASIEEVARGECIDANVGVRRDPAGPSVAAKWCETSLGVATEASDTEAESRIAEEECNG